MIADLKITKALIEDLLIADRGGLRVTPANIFAVVDSVSQERAEVFSDGWGYLCVRRIRDQEGAGRVTVV